MELRVLHYFLTVAREESFTRAAAALHISQPTLSRQIRQLEEELGKPLFQRTTQHVSLTAEGFLLRKRAEEILSLANKTEQEIRGDETELSGDIHIGSGESAILSDILKPAHMLQEQYPRVHFQIITGDGDSLMYYLEKGLIDFAFIYGDLDPALYESIPLPRKDRWGVYVRHDDPLAEKETVTAADLVHRPLILSRQTISHSSTHGDTLRQWFGRPYSRLPIANTFTMIYNGALMAAEGMGCLISFDNLLPGGFPGLTVRPLAPAVYAQPFLAWKKWTVFSPAAQKFLDMVKG